MVDSILAGVGAVLAFDTVILIFLGVVFGIIFGAIPGLSATMAVALFMPMTFAMVPIKGMSMLIGLYLGGVSGGLISAILLNIPGTPASIATTFDGVPMARRGEAGKALGASIVYSFLGGLFSIIILTLISPFLAGVALKFGPYEYFGMTLFSLTMISSLAGKNKVKGLISGLFGLTIGIVGMAPIDSFPRFTFGFNQLMGGFGTLPVLIGLFAIPQLLQFAESGEEEEGQEVTHHYKIRGFGFSLKEFFGQTRNFFRSSTIGVAIGILPGIGPALSNMMAYIAAKKRSKTPEKFGQGTLEGVVASESANNASVGGALIPLLALGIPGDTVTALLMGGLIIHGITPGPLLFKMESELVYGIFAALILANVMMLASQFLGMRGFVKILKIKKHYLLPVILALCFVGAYSVNNRIFDILTLVVFGVIGFLFHKVEIPIPPIVLGLILGKLVETNLRRGLMLSKGSVLPFFTHPISLIFILLSVGSLLLPLIREFLKRRRAGKILPH